MTKSAIEWTDDVWNPVVGCSIVSPGCTNCYAMRMAARLDRMGVEHYRGLTQPSKAGPVWTGKVALAPESVLLAPMRWRAPRKVFVNSMGDLFHESVPDEWIDRIFAVMALAPRHTFQVLTKRSKRMRTWCADSRTAFRVARRIVDFRLATERAAVEAVAADRWPVKPLGDDPDMPDNITLHRWPLPNVWLGVSAEDQTRADERVPDLLATPAALRFVSAEPLLGAIDFFKIMARWQDATPYSQRQHIGLGRQLIDWVIVGGESGPRARPMHPDWARGIRDQCKRAGTAFFFKQWGAWAPFIDRDNDDLDWRRDYSVANTQDDFQILNLAGGTGFHGERVHLMKRAGKTANGRLLDGREWNDWPDIPA